jgi:two-component system chemotaxis response regulator CheY
MAKTILIVEDSTSIRMIVGNVLKGAGYDVIEVTNGQEGLNVLNKTAQINMIITDINMPVMSGLEFAAKTKEMSIHKFTPILMLTTEISLEKKDLAKNLGVKAWMTKPFSPVQILKAVEKLAK